MTRVEIIETLERCGCFFFACETNLGDGKPPEDYKTCFCCDMLWRLKHGEDISG